MKLCNTGIYYSRVGKVYCAAKEFLIIKELLPLEIQISHKLLVIFHLKHLVKLLMTKTCKKEFTTTFARETTDVLFRFSYNKTYF